MAIAFSIIRYSSSSVAPKSLEFSFGRLLFSTCSSEAAEKFLTHLQRNQLNNVEKSLNSVKAQLDALCISQVLKRCATDKPQLAVRFFIWAALQPNYRHSSYMYSKACELLEIHKNPGIIACVIDDYRSEDFVASVKMFKVVLNLCKAAKDANMGLWVLRKMKEFNCKPDTVSYNVVIRLVVEKGELNEAIGLMREMGLIDLYPDIVTYVSIIKGFCDAGRLDDACGLIKVMKRSRCVPNAVIYSTLLDGICRHGTLEKAMELLNGLENENEQNKPNVVTYTTVINGFIEKGRMEEAIRVLDRMGDLGVKPNKVTIVAILDGLCGKGFVEDACKVIDKVSGDGFRKDYLYSMLVVSLMRSGKHKAAETEFRKMLARGMIPNAMALGSIIKRIISEGRVLDGFGLFDELAKSGSFIAIDSDIYSILLAELCKQNCLVEAAKVVNFMVERRIRLKSPLAENIIEQLKFSGEVDLASHLSSISN